jgi:nucleotide-binding universal stress UspA family protein
MMQPTSLASRAPSAEKSTAPLNILLATAGDPESIGAVRAAALLSRRLGSEVDVLAVVPPFPHAPATGLFVATPAVIDEETRKATMEATREQLRRVRGTSTWRVHSGVGWPVGSIVAAARRWHAGLDVMGTGEHSVMARLFGGETAVTAAKHTGTPILAVPAGFQRAPMNAYAAIDFTPSSIAGARMAARLLPRRGTLTLVHMSIFAKSEVEAGSITDLYSRGAADRLAVIAKQIRRATGRSVKTMIVDGTVPDVLLSLADRARGDLIALGSHERGLIDRLLIGSVRSQVLRKSACPVLITPHHGESPP